MAATPSEPAISSQTAPAVSSSPSSSSQAPSEPAVPAQTGDSKAAVAPDFPSSSNPWDEEALPKETKQEKPVTLPVSTPLEQSIFSDLKPASPPPVSKDILTEFDPLANREEQAAKDAWESSESHPPPPRTPSPPPRTPSAPPPSVPDKDDASTPKPVPTVESPTATSPFPSLASLARTFALPLTPLAGRSRPQSIDVARAVPSPSTLSSFANQQEVPPRQPTPASRSETPNATKAGGEAQFDFQKFLDQMKTRSAEPVSKYLRSFLSNFAKRTFTVNDQVKIINDFLSFIAEQMRNCDVWRNATDEEFDNAMEGMEKLVMNRLYEFTFTPQLQLAQPPRPITTDDLEKDRVLSQRIALFGWIEEQHLDIPEGEGSKGFLMFAQQELLKINHYKAPRDKLICILNSCKVIFGLIRHLKKEEGADSFLPILIFVVLKANPEHLLSNVEFINRFRNPEKLQSEAGYYLSSLMGAVSFIETMDHTSLSNIDQAEFEKNVELAIQALPPSEPTSPVTPFAESKIRPHLAQSHVGEESAQPLSMSTPSQSISDDAKRLLQKTGDTISKPLTAIGRIFSEAIDGAENKLAYLPGPFAPFELGREQRQQQAQGGPSVMGGLPQAPHSAGYPGPASSSQGQWQQLPPTSAPPGSAGSADWAVQQQEAMLNHYNQLSTTPRSAGAYPQTPYGGQEGGAWSSPASPNSPGFGGGEETPSRPGPQTHLPLAMGPSQPHLIQPRIQALSNAEAGGHISRTPTPALDLTAVQQQIDAANEEEAKENRQQLAQIFPNVGLGGRWIGVLEANGGDLGKSIEALLDMNSGE
ncbi:hypothetical protein FA13DRAFT_1726981 [Coprinellus micaceus]|uniref:VPS9 domain-containing protein n=1 Tax=Coprinellus micaceus TaxID=71717 RepID=A0A4Y7TR09_COPMI|nr:hypothetical protein FA13DRAFT_1726981 [Coprinellus micaceus]